MGDIDLEALEKELCIVVDRANQSGSQKRDAQVRTLHENANVRAEILRVHNTMELRAEELAYEGPQLVKFKELLGRLQSTFLRADRILTRKIFKENTP